LAGSCRAEAQFPKHYSFASPNASKKPWEFCKGSLKGPLFGPNAATANHTSQAKARVGAAAASAILNHQY